MELTCESVEDDCSSNNWQDFDTLEDTSLPYVVNVMSLASSDGTDEHSTFPAVPAVAKRPLMQPVCELPLKRNKTDIDCHVALQRLPQQLVQTAQMCKIIVSDKLNAPFLTSSRVPKTAPTQIFRQEDWGIKTEPDLLGTIVDGEQVSVLHPITEHHSANVNTAVNENMSRVSCLLNNNKPSYPHHDHSYVTVTKTCDASPHNAAVSPQTTATILHNNGAEVSMRSDEVERDISVILLNSAQPSITPASEATDAATSQPRDVSRLVLTMLQQQNVTPLPVINQSTTSVMRDENEQRGLCSSSGAVDDVAKVRKTLLATCRQKMALEKTLKTEQAKVRLLQAEINSLKQTVKHLLSASHARND